MAGYVYLIGSKLFRWYKIGKSSNASIRVSQLGVLLPFTIEVVAIWKVENHHEVEKLLHEKYQDHKINGEWFKFEKPEVEKIVHDMRKLGVASLHSSVQFNNTARYISNGNLIKYKVKLKLDLPPEERERRKREAIAKRAAKKAVDIQSKSA